MFITCSTYVLTLLSQLDTPIELCGLRLGQENLFQMFLPRFLAHHLYHLLRWFVELEKCSHKYYYFLFFFFFFFFSLMSTFAKIFSIVQNQTLIYQQDNDKVKECQFRLYLDWAENPHLRLRFSFYLFIYLFTRL